MISVPTGLRPYDDARLLCGGVAARPQVLPDAVVERGEAGRHLAARALDEPRNPEPLPRRPVDPLLPEVGRALRKAGVHLPRLLPDAPSSTCAMLTARFRPAPPSLSAASGILPAGSCLLHRRRHAGRILGAGSPCAEQPAVPWSMNVHRQRVAFLTRTYISSALHMPGTSGANWAMCSTIAARGRFARGGTVARDGTCRPPTGGHPSSGRRSASCSCRGSACWATA